jgi:hypothetical protein
MRELPIAFLGFLLAVNQVTMLKGTACMFEEGLRVFGSTTREPAGENQKGKTKS